MSMPAAELPAPRRLRYLVDMRPSALDALPPEWLVHDGPMRCPYLPRQTARLPLRMPLRPLAASELDEHLACGDRRQGRFLYRPQCPRCSACEAIRIPVEEFEPSRTQRRIFRRGECEIVTEIGRPCVTAEKVALYNRHKVERGLLLSSETADLSSYEHFLVESCTDTVELRYRHRGALIGVAVADRGAAALSAVYCYFDPAYERLSPGAYSILKEIALCRQWRLRHLYLGLYVAPCRSMSYKARYLPHERLIGGRWERFRRGAEIPPTA